MLLEIWEKQRGWETLSSHSQVVMMIDMKSAQGEGCDSPRYEQLMDVWALDGHIGSMEGSDDLVECVLAKGRETPKRSDIFHK